MRTACWISNHYDVEMICIKWWIHVNSLIHINSCFAWAMERRFENECNALRFNSLMSDKTEIFRLIYLLF